MKTITYILTILFDRVRLANEEAELDCRAALAGLVGLDSTADDTALRSGLAQLQESNPDATLGNERFAEACKALGLAEDASPEDFHAAVLAVPGQITAANEAAESLKTEKEGLETTLANERSAHSSLLLDVAVTEGRVLLSEKSDWSGRFANDYDGTVTALANEKDNKLPGGGQGKALNLGDRKQTLANEQERRASVVTLVNEYMDEHKVNYDTAWKAIKGDAKHAALFEAMAKPGE